MDWQFSWSVKTDFEALKWCQVLSGIVPWTRVEKKIKYETALVYAESYIIKNLEQTSRGVIEPYLRVRNRKTRWQRIYRKRGLVSPCNTHQSPIYFSSPNSMNEWQMQLPISYIGCCFVFSRPPLVPPASQPAVAGVRPGPVTYPASNLPIFQSTSIRTK